MRCAHTRIGERGFSTRVCYMSQLFYVRMLWFQLRPGGLHGEGMLAPPQMASPFKPSVNHVDSVENFDKIWTDQAAEDSPCGTPPAPDAFSAAAAAFKARASSRATFCLE